MDVPAEWRADGCAGAGQLSVAWEWLAIGCCLALVLHILRGWQLSGAGLRGLLDLGRAPFFLVWKLMVMLGSRGGSREWVRTKREGSQGESSQGLRD